MQRIALATVVALSLSVVACGGTEYAVRGSERAAGSDALIQIEDFEGGRHQVRVSFTNLPPPDRIGTGNTVFVLWSISRSQPPRNEGALEYDPENRTGVGVFVTAETALTVKVTAERNTSATSPSEVVVVEKAINAED